ncbi:hypothetical protein [Streptomyces aidingensis]|uniref:KAP family P-loop domain-containing protein n=1 Tax=Streptomyces aidingensis TaxID=910347 RepID=A0A1I1J5W9_9ACTN|nr:hypothetical protein [Streptomyces aidingensis]SFC43392.1 hypothetical protein SAMN05421773_103285 [Streptomyces aidingensis]
MSDTPPEQQARPPGRLRMSRREEETYRASVKTCLAAPHIARRLEKRPGVTAAAVREAMRTAANTERALAPCADTQRLYRAARRRLRAMLRLRSRRLAAGVWDRWLSALLLLAVAAVLSAVFGAGLLQRLALLPPAVAAAGAVGWRPASRARVGNLVAALAFTVRASAAQTEQAALAKKWARELEKSGTGPMVERVVQALLGDDPDSLLLPDSYEGLRSPRGPAYVVSSQASRRLRRKIEQIEGGTIAVCGPRGAGKTTLLEDCAREADFSVVAQAPASYTPHEFVISLFVRLCAGYLRKEGHAVPDIARLPAWRRLLIRVRRPLRRRARALLFAVPAAGLVLLGTYAAARSLVLGLRTDVESRTAQALDWTSEWLTRTWEGGSAGAALLVTLAGLAVWFAGGFAEAVRGVVLLARAVTALLGVALMAVAVVTVVLDPEIRHHAARAGSTVEVAGFVLVLVAWSVAVAWLARVRRRDGTLKAVVRRLNALMDDDDAVMILVVLVVVSAVAGVGSEPARAALADPENPLRLMALVLGAVLIRLSVWRPSPAEPELVTECRAMIYRLKTVQSRTTTLGGAAPQLLGLSASEAASFSTVPPAYPEVVADFRDLLTRIAEDLHHRGRRVLIAIDEVDRLGSSAQALAFLGEIKAILGVPRVHYLISVAEDVGAAFVRRGLPHRDVTDSSLDDVAHVYPCRLGESKEVLAKRAPGLSEPYVLLAHTLSGGLPRDLIRYSRRMLEMQDRTKSVELTDIARQLITEELFETLSGFRTLLGNERWSRENSAVLLSLRNLTALLGAPAGAGTVSDVRRALGDFALRTAPAQSGSETASALLDEASAYTYFSLTLLEIFGLPGFDRRRAAAGYRDGFQLLAEARGELAVSPHSTRPLIDEVRGAWGLPVRPAQGAAPPAPRPGVSRGRQADGNGAGEAAGSGGAAG